MCIRDSPKASRRRGGSLLEAILERDGAVEDGVLRRGVLVAAEIALAQELEVHGRVGRGAHRLHLAAGEHLEAVRVQACLLYTSIISP